MTGNLQSFSRSAWIAPIDPLPLKLNYRQPSSSRIELIDRATNPPTMTMWSSPEAEHLRLGDLLFAFMVASSPLMNTPPSFSRISNLARASRAGASSTSPEATL